MGINLVEPTESNEVGKRVDRSTKTSVQSANRQALADVADAGAASSPKAREAASQILTNGTQSPCGSCTGAGHNMCTRPMACGAWAEVPRMRKAASKKKAKEKHRSVHLSLILCCCLSVVVILPLCFFFFSSVLLAAAFAALAFLGIVVPFFLVAPPPHFPFSLKLPLKPDYTQKKTIKGEGTHAKHLMPILLTA